MMLVRLSDAIGRCVASAAITPSVWGRISAMNFGFGNPSPLFVLRDAEVAAPPDIKSEKHVFARFRQGSKQLRAKAWNFAERAAELTAGSRVDLVVQFEDDAWSAARGYAPWQTTIKDIRPAGATAAARR